MPFDLSQSTYLDFRKRVKEDPGNVVAIVGAGLSKPAGIPDWAGLKGELMKELETLMASIVQPTDKMEFSAKVARLSGSTNMWDDFGAIRHMLGKHVYRDRVTALLTLPTGTAVPQPYTQLWKLGIKGIVSFNLDSCPVDAFAEVRKKSVDQAAGIDSLRYSRFLTSTDQFVFYPHGFVKAFDTWKFTSDELAELLMLEPYLAFFSNLLNSKTVLLLGFNPEDFAFKALPHSALKHVRNTGAGPTHYVICPDPSPEKCEWLDQWGFVPIRYTPSDVGHTEVTLVLQSLLDYTSRDAFVPSVYVGDRIDPGQLPTEEVLVSRPIGECRSLLNSAVAGILSDSSASSQQKDDRLQLFLRERWESVHRAWPIADFAPHNEFFEYVVEKRLGRGAFGNVFVAKSRADGNQYALKMLLDECIREPEYLTCFRRGAHSMQILTSYAVDGMVPIHKAYEIPACIVMDYVDGKTLDAAVKEKWLVRLLPSLTVLARVAEIVNRGHQLREQVLHRDLKPTNVMLRSLIHDQDDPEVVVLDFDLSWHVGAYGLSVIEGARMQGYAAPEQTRPETDNDANRVSTRHTAVDVFGLGMVAFFVFTGRDPVANEQDIPGFRDTVVNGVMKRISGVPDWRVLPEELGNLVTNCTQTAQSARPAFDDVLARLKALRDMTGTTRMSDGDPLFLREVAYRIGTPSVDITPADADRTLVAKSGLRLYTLALAAHEQSPAIRFRIDRPLAGSDDRRHVSKYLKAKVENVAALLRRHQGKMVSVDSSEERCSVEAVFAVVEATPKAAQQFADVFISALREVER